MAANETRLVLHEAPHVVPAVLLYDGVVEIERNVVIVRIGRYDLLAEFRLEKIQRRPGNLARGHQRRVVSICQGVNTYADAVAIRIFEFDKDLVEVRTAVGHW